MKFVRQYISEEFIATGIQVDESAGKKSYFIEGIFMQGDKENRNKRVYPVNILAEKVQDYINEFVTKNRALGELGHPEGPTVNLDRVSHMITDIHQEGTNFVGKAKVLDTPNGKIVQNFIDEGVKLGVSSRGLGTVKRNRDGISEVQNDFKLATIDIVADPSAPDAFVDGIMENYDWYYENGILKAREIEQIKEMVKGSKSKRERNELAVDLFERFINQL